MVPISFLKAECPDPRPTKLGMKEMLHLTGCPRVSSHGPRDGVDIRRPEREGQGQPGATHLIAPWPKLAYMEEPSFALLSP